MGNDSWSNTRVSSRADEISTAKTQLWIKEMRGKGRLHSVDRAGVRDAEEVTLSREVMSYMGMIEPTLFGNNKKETVNNG